LALMTVMLSIGANATIVDGINYDLQATKEAWVIAMPNGDPDYSGVIYIPPYVTYNEVTYTVKGVNGKAFYNCEDLTVVTLAGGLKTIGDEAFSGCTNLQLTPLPETLTSIGESAFTWSGITDLSIPEGCSIGGPLFINCKKLKEVHLPASLDAIPNDMFYGDDALERIYCANPTPPTVGIDAFTNVNPTAVYVPVGSESAYKSATGWSAFSDAIISQIKNVEYEGILYDLNLVDRTATVTDNRSFDGAEVAIPTMIFYENNYYSVTAIDGGAFLENKNIEAVYLSGWIEEIGNYAFDKCTNLKTIVLSSYLYSIGNYAFRGTKNLETIFCDNSTPPTLGKEAFVGVNTAANLYVNHPSKYYADTEWSSYFTNIKDMYEYQPEAFVDGIKYHFYFSSNKATVIQPASTDPVYTGDIVIPEKVEFLGETFEVEVIDQWAFTGSEVTSVSISDRVSSIRSGAFAGAYQLTTITVDPNNYNYASLDGVLFSKDMKTLLAYPTAAATTYVIPDGVEIIWDRAFQEGPIAEVTMPASMTHIGINAFFNCSQLKKIVCWATTPPELSSNAFTGVSGASVRVLMKCIYDYRYSSTEWKSLGFAYITELDGMVDGINYHFSYNSHGASVVALPSGLYTGDVTIPEKVEFEGLLFTVFAIDERAFYDCEELTSVSLPATIQGIYEQAFDHCEALTSISIPASVISIGDEAFAYCHAMTSIEVETGNTKFKSKNGVLFSDDMQELIQYPGGLGGDYTVPTSVVELGPSAFIGNKNLTGVTLPAGLERINAYCFQNCTGLESVRIPSKVNRIWVGAFAYCKKLKTIFCEPATPPALGYLDMPFQDLASDYVIWLDESVYDAYAADTYWKTLNIRKDIIDEEDGFQYGDLFYDINLYNKADIYATLVSHPTEHYKGDVVIPDTIVYTGINVPVRYIDDKAFKDCNELTSVLIPNAVEEMGETVFYGCSNLMLINCQSLSCPIISDMTLVGVPSACVVKVRRLAWDSFIADDNWKLMNLEKVPEIGDLLFTDGWAHYDNGIVDGYQNTDPIAILIPGGSVTEQYLSHVSAYAYWAGVCELKVYQGGDKPEEGTLLAEDELTLETEKAFNEIQLKHTVAFDPTKNLWLVLDVKTGVISYSELKGAPNANARWIKPSIWGDCKDFYYKEIAWMVRAKFSALPTLEVTNLKAGSITAESAVITWNGTGDSYELRYQIESDKEDWKVTKGIMYPSLMLTDLESFSSYQVQVRAIRGTEVTEWTEIKFETPKSTADENAIKNVIDLIKAIGTVTYPDSKDPIDAARKAYDELADKLKDGVTNYSDLQDAETDYAVAKAEALKIKNVVVDPKYNSAAISWESQNESYEIRYRQTTEDEWTIVKDIKTTSFVISGLEAEKKYSLFIYGYSEGKLQSQNSTEFTTLAITPEEKELEAARARLQKLIGEYGALAAVAEKLGNTAIKSVLESQALAHSAKLTSNDIAVLNGEINSCLLELNGYISLLLPAAKAQVNDGLQALLLPTDSEACKKIIADAQAAINALEWSEEHTVAMIVSEATAIASQAEADLIAQRSKESGEETGLNDVQSDRVQSTKVLINGQIFIRRGEQLFDINGKQVK